MRAWMIVGAFLWMGASGMAATVLSIDGEKFALNGTPTFLCGISYYGALGADEGVIRSDLDEMQTAGFNWIRVWATWGAYENDVSAVGPAGEPREPYYGRLKALVEECDRRGMVVDVTLSRGNGQTGSPRLQGLDAHGSAVRTLVTGLRDYCNWYMDLSNERNIRDKRFTSSADLQVLRDLLKSIDPDRLVTASHAGDVDDEQLGKYVNFVRLDFITPHRPRDAKSPAQTVARTREYLADMRKLGRVLPVHYQEPFRRDFDKWQPGADDFVADLQGAIEGGAAGWCLHNGGNRGSDDGRPRRSFDLREGPLFANLDEAERSAIPRVKALVDAL